MMWNYKMLIVLLLLHSGNKLLFAQEEESAEVYLEEYTDQIQEIFFEALKQKSIENYDRAINLFLECKQLQSDNEAIDHELAKVYLAEKNYVPALESAIAALEVEPTNFWYLHTLVEIMRAQGRSALELKERIPYDNYDLKKNLVRIYYRQRNYDDALSILKEMQASDFRKELTSKIRDSIEQLKKNVTPNALDTQTASDDPLTPYKTRLELLYTQQQFETMEEEAVSALELFPTQPYFYYMLGKAMISNNKMAQAVEILESCLDFLLDDTELNNQIYSELSNAYRALGNPTKANMYLSKVKDGS